MGHSDHHWEWVNAMVEQWHGGEKKLRKRGGISRVPRIDSTTRGDYLELLGLPTSPWTAWDRHRPVQCSFESGGGCRDWSALSILWRYIMNLDVPLSKYAVFLDEAASTRGMSAFGRLAGCYRTTILPVSCWLKTSGKLEEWKRWKSSQLISEEIAQRRRGMFHKVELDFVDDYTRT